MSRIPRQGQQGWWIVCCVLAVLLNACSSDVEKLWIFSTGSPLYSTPLVVDDLIVFGSESGTFHAVDSKGQARWQFQVPSSEIFSRPQSDGKLIFFGATNQTFYAMDLKGQARWVFTTKERIKSDPTVLNGVVYLTSYDGHVYALSTDSGKKLWQFPPLPAAPPAASNSPAAAVPPIKPEAFSYAAPTIQDNVMYVGNLDGHMYALNIADGTLKWRFQAGEGITSTASVEKGVVYFGSKDDNLYAIDAATGSQVKWKFKTGGDVLSSPKIQDGVIAIGSNDSNFYILDAETGKEKCRFTAAGPIISYGVFFQNLVFFNGGQGDNSIYAIERDTCKSFWSFKTGYKIESDPVIAGDRLYVTSGDTKLYAFKINKKAKS